MRKILRLIYPVDAWIIIIPMFYFTPKWDSVWTAVWETLLIIVLSVVYIVWRDWDIITKESNNNRL